MNEKIHFQMRIIGDIRDAEDDNVDVEVQLGNGTRYSATFFTLKNLARLFTKNRETGECQAGLYLWAADMIIVEQLSPDVIEKTIIGLLTDEEFKSAFSEISQENP